MQQIPADPPDGFVEEYHFMYGFSAGDIEKVISY